MTATAQATKAEYQRQYRQRNRERLNEYRKAWNKANPEKVKQYQENYWNKKAIANACKKEGVDRDE